MVPLSGQQTTRIYFFQGSLRVIPQDIKAEGGLFIKLSTLKIGKRQIHHRQYEMPQHTHCAQ